MLSVNTCYAAAADEHNPCLTDSGAVGSAALRFCLAAGSGSCCRLSGSQTVSLRCCDSVKTENEPSARNSDAVGLFQFSLLTDGFPLKEPFTSSSEFDSRSTNNQLSQDLAAFRFWVWVGALTRPGISVWTYSVAATWNVA